MNDIISCALPLFEDKSWRRVFVGTDIYGGAGESGPVLGVIVDSRHPNTSVTTIKVDQPNTITTQAGVTTQDRRLVVGITSSPDGPHWLQLDFMERLVGQLP